MAEAETIQAYCRRCAYYAATAAERQPFALPGARAHYAPDRPARVDHIALTLSFDFENKTLFGRCATRITAVEAVVHAIEMDAAQLTVLAVWDEAGRSLRFDLLGAKLRTELAQPLARGDSATIAVEYEARRPRQGIYFIAPDQAYPAKPVQVWTQSQDQDAHYWFPCVDHPNAKATTEITATVPEDFFVLSNGSLAATTADDRKQTKTYHWKMEAPHATYLVSCVAGRFSGHTDTVGDLPVSYYVQPGREEDGQRSFGKTPAMIKFFAGRLRFGYPFAKYAQVAVSDFVFGGMENTTATTQSDLTLHDARAHLDFSSDPLVAHELAHQWFGDLITCKDWSHAWLNEGFATYFEALFREHDRGRDEFEYYRLELQERYKREDDGLYRRPIVTNVYAEPIDLFDRHLYEKGACVLHMIRIQLGDELWWRAMHHYVSVNAGRSVETIDLARSLEEVSGRNFLPFLDQWVFKGGHPEFAVAYAWDAQTKTAQIKVRQTQDTSDGTPLFSVPLLIEFAFATGPSLSFAIVCDAKEQAFHFPLRSNPSAFSFDPAADMLKSVELEVPTQMLLNALACDGHVAGRVQAARALVKAANPDVIDALGRSARRDAFWGVQAEAARALGRIRHPLALDALIAARAVEHPKARRAVAEAIGEYRGAEACAALAPLLAEDASYFVEAAAATSIGRTKGARAYELLIQALGAKESWNDIVRVGVIAGLAELADERSVGQLIAWTGYGKPTTTRCAAVGALAKVGEGDGRVRDALFAALDDGSLFVRRAAAEALEALAEPKALDRLDRIAAEDVDGRLKRACAKAARSIRGRLQSLTQTRQLRDELAALQVSNGTLQGRLDALERKTAPTRTTPARRTKKSAVAPTRRRQRG
ncbi:MAG: M1 family metallopeptidase [Candidatus Eremiobacteraeota bacterium]|nr:M1 family metallopeptidase [Candidatus Eremiobacteraeota bacterium]